MTTINAQTIINAVMQAHAVAPYFDKNGEHSLIEFQTSSRGIHKVVYCKENLAAFAKKVRQNATAFGGGLIREAKPKPVISWPTKLITLFKQSMEDHDYRAAFDIADQKLGALFAFGTDGRAFMQVAPVPFETDTRFASVMNTNGEWVLIDPISMLSANGHQRKSHRSRASILASVADQFAEQDPDHVARIYNAAIKTPANQLAARAAWLIEHGLESEETAESTTTDEASALIDIKAAQDVAQVVAQVVATIAISEAMQNSEAGELVTCEAGESEATAMARKIDRLTREVKTGKTNNGGVICGLRPSAIEKRISQLAELGVTVGSPVAALTPPSAEFLPDDAPPSAEFLEALAASDNAWENGKKASKAMEQFPRGAMGLILDSVKSTPEYQAAKREEESSIAQIKAANTYLRENFKAEYLAHRAEKREAKQFLLAPTLRGEWFAATQTNRIASRSGKWQAWLWETSAGAIALGFSAQGEPAELTTYATKAERMKALQALARAADAPTDTPPGGLPCTESVATPPVAASKPPVAVTRNIVPDNGLHIIDDAFEAWTFISGARFAFVMYLGKSAKPWKYYGYPTEAKRDDGFNRHATEARDILAHKAKRKTDAKAQADKPHGLQVGDVVRSSWGYDQTNVDHYQIVKVIGKRTVEVRQLAEHDEATGDMSGRAAPIPNEFVGEVLRRQVDSSGAVNMLHASYGRAYKIEPLTVVHGVRCYAASHYSSYA